MFARAAERDRTMLPRRHHGRPRIHTLLAPERAYAGIPAWLSREHWLSWTVPIAIGLRPELLKRHHVATSTFRLWARCESLYADHKTGRRVIVRPDQVASLMEVSERTVQNCRAAARELDILVDVVEGRMLTRVETLPFSEVSPIRGISNESACTTPTWLVLAVRTNPQVVDIFTPTSSGVAEPQKLPVHPGIPRRARDKAAPSSPQLQRRSPAGAGESAVDPQKFALRAATAALARELVSALPWLGEEQPGRIRPILARFVRGPLPWSATDVRDYLALRDTRLQQPAVTADRIRTRPAAVLAAALRDADPQADHPRGDQLIEPVTPPPAVYDRAVRPTRPPWCGECSERTRHVELTDGRMARCRVCHPLSVESPGRR